jgi:hypothetical protein
MLATSTQERADMSANFSKSVLLSDSNQSAHADCLTNRVVRSVAAADARLQGTSAPTFDFWIKGNLSTFQMTNLETPWYQPRNAYEKIDSFVAQPDCGFDGALRAVFCGSISAYLCRAFTKSCS